MPVAGLAKRLACCGCSCPPYLAADTARKHDPQPAVLYQRLMEERGSHNNQATCAVASYLADRVYAVEHEDSPTNHVTVTAHPSMLTNQYGSRRRWP